MKKKGSTRTVWIKFDKKKNIIFVALDEKNALFKNELVFFVEMTDNKKRIVRFYEIVLKLNYRIAYSYILIINVKNFSFYV